jgi:hypothetical protein
MAALLSAAHQWPCEVWSTIRCRYVKAAASVLLVLGIITAAANVWCLGPINKQYIPQAVRHAEIVLERKVRLGGMTLPMLAVAQSSALSSTYLSGQHLGCNRKQLLISESE